MLIGAISVDLSRSDLSHSRLYGHATAQAFLLAGTTGSIDFFEAKILQRIPHNPKHFVQGLQLDGDILWEGTGLYGASKLIKQRFNRTVGTLEPLYEKALSSIADANITTLIAAIVLFTFGTGPIRGFAVTLSLGIITSLFTAIVGTRSVINFIYGGRRVQRLAI